MKSLFYKSQNINTISNKFDNPTSWKPKLKAINKIKRQTKKLRERGEAGSPKHRELVFPGEINYKIKPANQIQTWTNISMHNSWQRFEDDSNI